MGKLEYFCNKAIENRGKIFLKGRNKTSRKFGVSLEFGTDSEESLSDHCTV